MSPADWARMLAPISPNITNCLRNNWMSRCRHGKRLSGPNGRPPSLENSDLTTLSLEMRSDRKVEGVKYAADVTKSINNYAIKRLRDDHYIPTNKFVELSRNTVQKNQAADQYQEWQC